MCVGGNGQVGAQAGKWGDYVQSTAPYPYPQSPIPVQARRVTLRRRKDNRNKQERGLSFHLVCQHGSDQPLKLLRLWDPTVPSPSNLTPQPRLGLRPPLWLPGRLLEGVAITLPATVGPGPASVRTGGFSFRHHLGSRTGRSRPPPGHRSLTAAWARPEPPSSSHLARPHLATGQTAGGCATSPFGASVFSSV